MVTVGLWMVSQCLLRVASLVYPILQIRQEKVWSFISYPGLFFGSLRGTSSCLTGWIVGMVLSISPSSKLSLLLIRNSFISSPKAL